MGDRTEGELGDTEAPAMKTVWLGWIGLLEYSVQFTRNRIWNLCLVISVVMMGLCKESHGGRKGVLQS